MKFAGVLIFALACIAIQIVQGTGIGYQPAGCYCAPKIVYVNNCPTNPNNPNNPNNPECAFMPCDATVPVCGAVNTPTGQQCMTYKCINDLNRESCKYNSKIENVSMGYCKNNTVIAAGFKPCARL